MEKFQHRYGYKLWYATHQFPVRLRVFAPTEVTQGPGSIPKHAEFVVFAQQG